MGATIMQNSFLLRHSLRYFDPRLSGRVSLKDFKEALVVLNDALVSEGTGCLTKDQIEEMVSNMTWEQTLTGDQVVNYDTFLKSFQIVDKKAQKTTAASGQALLGASL